MMKSILPYCFSVFTLLSLLFFSCASKGDAEAETQTRQSKISPSENSAEVNVEEKWELPEILKEVSGIAFVSDNIFACIQDEDGTIFLYNTHTAEIEKEIPFAGAGDYEGIALAGNIAYVVRSDAKIYKVENWESDNPTVSEYDTPLTDDDNVEGLFYDKQDHRLLLAVKDGKKENADFKGIYAFDLATNRLDKEPVIKIDLNDPLLSKSGEKKKSKRFRPSEIGIHPVSGEIYITDGPAAKLLIMDRSGEIKSLIQLDEAIFPQAEGLTFGASGEIFISNEGKKGKGNIIKVAIQQN